MLTDVRCNLHVKGNRTESYQWKGPLGFLERNAQGALIHQWWAILDLNQ